MVAQESPLYALQHATLCGVQPIVWSLVLGSLTKEKQRPSIVQRFAPIFLNYDLSVRRLTPLFALDVILYCFALPGQTDTGTPRLPFRLCPDEDKTGLGWKLGPGRKVMSRWLDSVPLGSRVR